MMDRVFFNNSLRGWIYALATVLFVFALTRLIRGLLLRWLAKSAPQTSTVWDDLLVEILGRIHLLFLLVAAIYFGTLQLSLADPLQRVIGKTFLFVMLLQIGIIASRGLRFGLDRYRLKSIESNAEAVTTLSAVAFLLRMLLWVVLLLVALDNFGVNVTTLIAGLGVGGIAVALAVQNILSDLFASFSIVLDKPFVIGDFIIVGDCLGTVEYIGLKTTRLRSLSGEQLIFSNADLLASRIRNYKRMVERRVVFTIGVLYQTPVQQLEAIPMMLREIVESQKQVRFDRAHFKAYGAYSLDFEIVYWVHSPDYNIYMDIQQAINLAILRQFQEAGIEFAYPTHTVYFNRDAENPPS